MVTRVLNSVSPEPKLISLKNDDVKKNIIGSKGVEEKKSEESKDRTENEKRESLISEQLNKMKFTTSLNFDLD